MSNKKDDDVFDVSEVVGEDRDAAYQRATGFKCLELFCGSFCISTLCLWIMFALVFGTGKLFTWVRRSGDTAVSWNA